MTDITTLHAHAENGAPVGTWPQTAAAIISGDPVALAAHAHDLDPVLFPAQDAPPPAIGHDTPTKDLTRQADGKFHCPEPGCDFNHAVKQGIGTHRYRKHSPPDVAAAFRSRLSAAQTGMKRPRAGSSSTAREAALLAADRRRARMSLPELEAIVAAWPLSKERSAFLKLRADVSRKGRDVIGWERRRLAEFQSGKRTTAAPVGRVVAVSPVQEARIAERQLQADRAAADELFDRMAAATDVLFPERVPSSRILEVAGWQQDTLRMMTR